MQIELISSSELARGRRFQTSGVLAAMPFTRAAEAERAARLMAQRAGVDGLIVAVHDDVGDGFISLVNQVFRASSSPWFAYVAQDAFAGRGWLAAAVAAMERQQGSLLAFNDGKWSGALAAFGLVRRAWAATNYSGDLFYPGYRRHYADAELTVLALQQQRLVYTAEGVLVEVDWGKDDAPVDPADRALYHERVRTGFDGRVRAPQLLKRFA
ncbi:hypothetical protein SAMN06265795_11490 [Noviherbaspirillum humi]|uniref:Uncharacterized protein n=1 Tax=Noviherbaspirillum humi TaxID=1688639 RepID=A0A239K297_9BURK|nr:hypothetical protein [Noviherbaspirillum humi]SNT11908.1 hypothetical protein SAMN06265795_11490 [Noviherbaspirillum humi]